MDLFRLWKRYPRAIEGALVQAGYGDAEFSVHRADGGATGGRWRWTSSAAELNCRQWPHGLELAWDSATGWTYRGGGGEKPVALPVPALAAPHAITALMPALMDGRRRRLPMSEARWEHAAAVSAWAEGASAFDDDKYDAAYQSAEEEASDFLRWQAQMDGAKTEERSAEEHRTTETDAAPGTQDGTDPPPPDAV
ncbi:hypothetical protein OG458_42475 (plasmid) [Streptomyces sp. NBC_01281]|nr:hypothetical protein OG458_41330 [Streptomyces sp. NBC_01281]WSK66622.1 hypothetical protein OG458_42475 [Streptomyces sp. NBC_01281]